MNSWANVSADSAPPEVQAGAHPGAQPALQGDALRVRGGALVAAGLLLALLLATAYRGPGVDLPVGAWSILLLGALAVPAFNRVLAADGDRFLPVWCGFGAFAGLLAANQWTSMLPENGFVPALTLMMLPAACVVTWYLLDRGWAVWIAAGVTLVGALSAGFAIGEFAVTRARSAGLQSDPNLLASLLNATFFLGWAGWLAARRMLTPFVRHAWLAALLVIVVGLACTFSRGGLACWLAAALALGVVLARARQPLALLALPFVVALLANVTTVAVAAPEVSQRFGGESHLARGLGHRQAMWGAAVASWLDAPLSGHGLQSFHLRYPALRPLSEQVSAGNFVHNDYLQALHDGGPALLLFVAGFVALIGGRWLRLALARRADTRALLVLGGATGVAAVAVQAMINFAMYVLPLLVLFGIVLGLATWKPPRQPSAADTRRWSTVGLAGVALVLAGYLLVDVVSAGLLLGQRGVPGIAALQATEGRYERTLRVLAAANPARVLPVLGLASLERYRTRVATTSRERMIAYGRTLALYERAVDRDPYSVTALVSWAAFMLEQRALLPPERHVQIERILAGARSLDPTDIAPYLLHVRWLEESGQPQAALSLLEREWLPWRRIMLRRFPDNTLELLDRMERLALDAGRADLVEQARSTRAWVQRFHDHAAS